MTVNTPISPTKATQPIATGNVQLLLEVIKQTDIKLSPTQWDQVAINLGRASGNSARESWRTFLIKLKAENDGPKTEPDTETPGVKTPRKQTTRKKKEKVEGPPAKKAKRKACDAVELEEEEEVKARDGEYANGQQWTVKVEDDDLPSRHGEIIECDRLDELMDEIE